MIKTTARVVLLGLGAVLLILANQNCASSFSAATPHFDFASSSSSGSLLSESHIDSAAFAFQLSGTPKAMESANSVGIKIAVTGTMQPGDDIQCALDGALAQSCRDFSKSGLNEGSHTLVVTAKSSQGVELQRDVVSWLIDNTAPVVALTSLPSASGNKTVVYDGQISENGSGLDRLECSFNGAAYKSCSFPFSVTVADGTYTAKFRAFDKAGNQSAEVSAAAIVVDSALPAVTFTSKPKAATNAAKTVTVAFTSMSNGAAATAECSLQNAAFATCTSPQTVSVPSEGAYSFRVRGRSAAGNATAPIEATWIVDRTPPTLTIASAMPTLAPNPQQVFNANPYVAYQLLPTRDAAIVINFTAADNVAISQVTCTLQQNGNTLSSGACTGSAKFTNLSEGAYRVFVDAYDTAGNDVYDVFDFTVDTKPPMLLSQLPGFSNGMICLSDSVTDRTSPTWQIAFDGGAYANMSGGPGAQTVGSDGISSFTFVRSCASPLAGAHTAQIRVVDAAGNATNYANTFSYNNTAAAAIASGVPLKIHADNLDLGCIGATFSDDQTLIAAICREGEADANAPLAGRDFMALFDATKDTPVLLSAIPVMEINTGASALSPFNSDEVMQVRIVNHRAYLAFQDWGSLYAYQGAHLTGNGVAVFDVTDPSHPSSLNQGIRTTAVGFYPFDNLIFSSGLDVYGALISFGQFNSNFPSEDSLSHVTIPTGWPANFSFPGADQFASSNSGAVAISNANGQSVASLPVSSGSSFYPKSSHELWIAIPGEPLRVYDTTLSNYSARFDALKIGWAAPALQNVGQSGVSPMASSGATLVTMSGVYDISNSQFPKLIATIPKAVTDAASIVNAAVVVSVNGANRTATFVIDGAFYKIKY